LPTVVALPNPVMTAAGTAGHGTELSAHLDLPALGAHVVKSLAPYPWDGNPAPRLHPTAAGMLNAVGLQGPGVAAWLADDVPALLTAGVRRIVVSIWGRTIDDYAAAAEMLAAAPPEVIAVEVNLSCPNLRGHAMFAQDPAASAEVMRATAAAARPRWAKLTAAVTSIADVASAAHDGGAEALVCVNTLLGMVIDVEARRPALGTSTGAAGTGGGLSGPAIHPVAVRAVHDVHRALPHVPIVGVGGVRSGVDAVELLMAGASAVQVGTATFADPAAPTKVLAEIAEWCERHGVNTTAELVGAACR
jgi:dihydroorotate dehydrogenase (NAD+) catalytic subunit